jgi:hypothetical protein
MGTSDGRATVIMLDKLVCDVLRIIVRTNGLGATAEIMIGMIIIMAEEMRKLSSIS